MLLRLMRLENVRNSVAPAFQKNDVNPAFVTRWEFGRPDSERGPGGRSATAATGNEERGEFAACLLGGGGAYFAGLNVFNFTA